MSDGRQNSGAEPTTTRTRPNAVTSASNRLLDASVRVFEANVPPGMWSATAQTTAQAPTLVDIRKAKYIPARIENEATSEREFAFGVTPGQASGSSKGRKRANTQTSIVEYNKADGETTLQVPGQSATPTGLRTPDEALLNPLHLSATGRYPNGYKFPPKHTWSESIAIGFHAFLMFTITPFGFLITIYGLNVVAWGAMIFFLLIGAASPTMCWVQRPYGSGHYVHDCNDLYSPRRIWIEIDSQVLTALFCVTAFGLVPWRFRDLWFLLRWRMTRNEMSLRKLAAWHRGWFRLPGSDELDPTCKFSTHDTETNISALPEPLEKAPDSPLTGIRATPTSLWKMDFVIWCMAMNTFMQVVLCYFMWHMSRFRRPSWATGLFVTLGCVSAGVGGIVQFVEGKRIKRTEGIPIKVGQAVATVVEKRGLIDGSEGLEEV